MQFTPAFLRRTAAAIDLDPDRAELVTQMGVRDTYIEHIASALHLELERGCPSPRLFTDSLASALAVHLLSAYLTAGQVAREHKGGLAPHRLRRAVEYVNDRLGDDLSLAEIAAAAGLSEYHFARQFKRSTGRAPHRYVLEQRIKRAKQLLAETRLPVVDICLAVGFQSQSHFSAVFRKLTGVTPKRYREKA